jgi:RimJ/RimL family protein N-acetyltransferase
MAGEDVVAFVPRVVTLKDGRRALIRAGGPGDAVAFREYLLRAVPSADGVGLFADEVGSVEFYQEKLAKYLPARGGLGLFAEPVGSDGPPVERQDGSADGPPGPIVGDCGLVGFDRRKLAGVLVMGMMCDQGWRGVGLGRALLSAALEWARANASSSLRVRRVELGVRATNPGALALYRSMGFVEEGRHRGRFRQADGSLVDDLAMALEVG